MRGSRTGVSEWLSLKGQSARRVCRAPLAPRAPGRQGTGRDGAPRLRDKGDPYEWTGAGSASRASVRSRARSLPLSPTRRGRGCTTRPPRRCAPAGEPRFESAYACVADAPRRTIGARGGHCIGTMPEQRRRSASGTEARGWPPSIPPVHRVPCVHRVPRVHPAHQPRQTHRDPHPPPPYSSPCSLVSCSARVAAMRRRWVPIAAGSSGSRPSEVR